MSSAEIWVALLQGLLVTIQLSALSLGLALALGVPIGVLRLAPARLPRALAEGYVALFRGLPLLPVLAFVYLGLPKAGLGLDSALASAAWGLGVYTAAFVAEAVRAGLLAVPPGQAEAARSLGLGPWPVLRRVLLPQAIRAALPPLGTVAIALVKNSSLASAVAVPELMYRVDELGGRSFKTWPLLAAFGLYLCLTVPLAMAVGALERRQRGGLHAA